VRREWLNLNGVWEFAFDDAERGLDEGWHDGRPLAQRITVPFPYQASLSGIGDRSVHEVVWYARDIYVPAAWRGQNVLLHFGAVDYQTTVWLNGREVGHNRGGHVPFWFDISPYLEAGANRLTVRVEDRQDPRQPRGKQASSGVPGGIDYYCTTGIWQTVWLEPVPAIRIDELRLRPRLGDVEDLLEVTVCLHAPATGWQVDAEALDGGAVVARAESEAGAVARLTLHLPQPKRWTPDSPHLYDLRVRLWQDGELLDDVASYAGLRSVGIAGGRVLLNGEPVYLLLALDQGYWPDGLLAAPSDAALRADVEWAKRFGFNGVRKHQKVEDPRWLYWCDRLGLLVWAEMPNARAWSTDAEEWLLAEWERAVRRTYNHPCVVAWAPVNETMGFPGVREHHPGQIAFLERLVDTTRRLEPDGPVIDNDGWEHTDITDLCGIHDYTPTAAELRQRYAQALDGGSLPERIWTGAHRIFARGARYRGQPVLFTEAGGFLLRPDLPPEALDGLYGLYASFTTPDELLAKYADMTEGLASLPFLAGFCYTQLVDVEHEINGLLTYDRRPKVPPEAIAALHRRCFGDLGERGRRIRQLAVSQPATEDRSRLPTR
jgi:beta-galactosidase/beta-glucuronidase